MKLGLVLSALLISSLSFGQKADSFDFHVADYRLLLNKKIQAEVGITQPQRDRLNKLADGERAQVLPYLQQLQKQGKTERDLQTDKTYLGYLRTFRGQVLSSLQPNQLRRLRELSLQSVDLGGLMDPMVAKSVGVSDDQVKKIRGIYSNGVKQSGIILETINKEVISKYNNVHVKSEAEAKSLNEKIQAMRQEGLRKHQPELKSLELQTKRQIQAVLTTKQMASYRALEGKPFSLK